MPLAARDIAQGCPGKSSTKRKEFRVRIDRSNAHRRPRRVLAAVLYLAVAVLAAGRAYHAGAAAPPAGPTLALDPDRGPCGVRPIARGAGFPADLPVLLQRGGDNGPVVGRGAAGADGAFAITLDVLCDPVAPPPGGTAVMVVASPDGSRGAPSSPLRVSATFTVTAGAALVPTIALDPDRGPCETRPLARGVGFPAGTTIAIFVLYPSPRPPSGGGAQIAQMTADGAGAFAMTLPIVGCGPGEPEGAQFTISAGVAATDGPFARAVFTVERTARERYFPETGFAVRGRFLEYWRAHGLDLGDPAISERESLALFGFPLSPEFTQRLEDGKEYTVQYFERARFERHPENRAPYDVLLGQFGRRILATMPDAPTAPAPASTKQGYTHVRETGHNVAPDFSLFWSRNGGLAQFGYPLSEEFAQRLEDGQVYTVQYFERARFERHPENAPPFDVLLGQFGRRVLAETAGR